MNELITFFVLFFGVGDAVMPQPTRAQIQLVEKMGHDEFTKREEASEELKQLGRDALLAIERHGLYHKDPEIVHRSKSLLADFYGIGPSSKRGFPSVTGLVKLKEVKLPSGKKFIIPKGTARALYELEGGDHLPEWRRFESGRPELQLAVANWSGRLLRAGYSRKDVVAILDAVERNSSNWEWYDLCVDEDKLLFSGQFDPSRP